MKRWVGREHTRVYAGVLCYLEASPRGVQIMVELYNPENHSLSSYYSLLS